MNESSFNTIEFPYAFEGMHSITSPTLNNFIFSTESVILNIFLLASTPRIKFLPASFLEIDIILVTTGFISFSP